MLSCFVTTLPSTAVPISVVPVSQFDDWLGQQPDFNRQWLNMTGAKAEAGVVRYIPSASGEVSRILCVVSDSGDMWGVGHLPFSLPEGTYKLDVTDQHYLQYALAWGLGAYQFTRYKKPSRSAAVLYVSTDIMSHIEGILESIYLVRDCINTPTEEMGPSEFAAVFEAIGAQYNADVKQLIGDALLKNNYPCIHTVGRASDDAPRLLDLTWGNPAHPKVTLVGKGVCFDSGGLDIKPSAYMLLMKKDMGGAANALGLARMIMHADLPVRLRLLIPAVENVISGNAYRPGDVIRSRKGLTIEVGNTDAEGRLVLCDALAEAVDEQPDLLIDIATLTGAARVALGTELPALFCNQDAIANDVIRFGEKKQDPLWRMPLHAPYRDHITSQIADLNNNSSEATAGAISAALFLQAFVPNDISWMHIDLMAWNTKTRPGRPQGGEAVGMRALFEYIKYRYSN